MKTNPLTQIDFYKTGHIFQYPKGTTEVYSNFTARSDRLAPVLRNGVGEFDGKVVFVGMQGFIKSFLQDTFNAEFFSKEKSSVIAKYKRRMDTSLGEGAVPVEHIEALHDLGYLPLEIKALPEGSLVNLKIPLFTIRNTLPEFFWLVNYLETVFSNNIWKTITVATIARQYRRLLDAYADRTGVDKANNAWLAHDFSSRGMSGMYDAAASSFGHLLSFTGSDAVAAIDYAEDYYNANADVEFIAGSIPATEHSVMCMGGELDELGTYKRLITEVYPSGLVSIVSDTWDFWRVISEYTVTLKEDILNRKPNAIGQAKVVFRPDSGDPVKILAGYRWGVVQDARDKGWMAFAQAEGLEAIFDQVTRKYYAFESVDTGETTEYKLTELRECEVIGAVECLWDVFGGTKTAKGYRVLHERVGLIYGDSITLERAQEILARLSEKGYASNNVVFGVGSFSYNYLTRDCFGFAMKATSGVVGGNRRELFKDPATDNGEKRSAKGLLRVEKIAGDYVLFDSQTPEQEAQGELKTIFKDGVLTRETSLQKIRELVRVQSEDAIPN